MDRKVTAKQLKNVALFFSGEWRKLARELLLPARDIRGIEAFEHVNNDPTEIVHKMLEKWHDRNGSDATVKSICSILVRSPINQRLAAEEAFGVGVVRKVIKDL